MSDTDDSVKATSTARTADFSSTKPLPPIGSVSDNEGTNGTHFPAPTEDDARSIDSSSGLARPKIVRNFRPESISDDEIEDEKRTLRSVSFNEGPMTQKRKTYDGREITMVTLNTQTDWDWVEKKEMFDTSLQRADKTSTPDTKDKLSSPKSGTSKLESQEGKAMTPDVTPFNMPYNDEYGIPILDLSSDTDDSSDEEVTHRKVKDDRTFMPSVGPPNILQYQRESEKHEIPVDEPEARLADEEYEKDESGVTHGMFSGLCEFCQQPIKPFPTMDQQRELPPETLYCCNEYREFVEEVLSATRDMEEEQSRKNKLIDIKPHEHVGSKQERNAAKEKAVQRMRERELQRRQQEASGLQQNFFAFARQMKTINYQLSSQKCLEEGWTVRAPSPLCSDDGDDVFTPEPLNPEMLANGKLRDRPLIEKFYESGQKFLTMFPDGTGNVFYPSGNLAILISSVKLGQYNYTIHHDLQRSGVAAAFEPNGHGYCYFPNGDIRLYIDQYGGIELDNIGGKRRKWSWKDQLTHVHAPPFQPICIGLNRNLGVRVMSQDNISVTFSSNKRSARFNMGARLKLVAPENAPLKEVEEDQIFLEEKKTQVDALLDKVANLLKFPNNPKLDKMLPPLHVTSKQNKTEKLKQDRQIFLAQKSSRDKKQSSIGVN